MSKKETAPFIAEESEEDLRELGLLADSEDADNSPAEEETPQSSSESVQERTYTKSEVDQLVSFYESQVQRAKDREIGKLRRQISERDEELASERELREAYKKLTGEAWSVDDSSKKAIDLLEGSHENRRNTTAQRRATEEAVEKAASDFDRRWNNTMEELAEDVSSLGLSAKEFESSVYKHSDQLLSDLDWDAFRRRSRAEIRRMAASRAVSTRKDEAPPPVKAKVPTSAGGGAAPKRSTPTNFDEMSSEDLDKYEEEQIRQALER